MKGYIYTMSRGADPQHGWILNDPIFEPVPTLGACMPNIRRNVEVGDYIFTISGRVRMDTQYIVGGFKVREKIDALEAFGRFPHNRLHIGENGQVLGNIIVDKTGRHNKLDYHSNFLDRVENYIVGESPVLVKPSKVRQAREDSVAILQHVLKSKGATVFDLIGRWRKLSSNQVLQLLTELRGFAT